MLFLIVYDKRSAQLEELTSFTNEAFVEVSALRLEAELAAMARDQEVEIVILEAESEAVIRKTHTRYFEDLAGIVETETPSTNSL